MSTSQPFTMENSDYESDEFAKDVSLADNLGVAIAGHVARCLYLFHHYIAMPGIVPDRTIMDDQLARFRLWAADMAIYEPHNASLDYRIRLSPRVADILHQLLDIICDTLLSREYLYIKFERMEG